MSVAITCARCGLTVIPPDLPGDFPDPTEGWVDDVCLACQRAQLPRRLPDGRIEAPMRAEAPDGTIGDAVVVLAPGDEGFDAWDGWLAQHGETPKRT